jgi:hypothetical protein
LQAPLVDNGAGVLVEPHGAVELASRQSSINQAIDAMNSLAEWPREQAYE